MDSLIVLRKPLRTTHLAPKFIIPKKQNDIAPKVDPIPLEPLLPLLGLADEAQHEPTISFVKLYRDLCIEKCRPSRARARPTSAESTRLHFNTPASQVSAASFVTRYKPYSGDVQVYPEQFPDSPFTTTARAELMLELDYGTSFRDSRLS